MEIWKPIIGFEGLYEVSNYGNIKSLEKIRKMPNGNTRVYSEKILKQYNNNRGRLGYKMVYFHYLGKKYVKYVHRLVAIHFVENINNYNIINHIDGNSLNNIATNLEWCTLEQNNNHAVINNLRPLGEDIYNSKFSNNDVIKIRDLYNTGKYSQMYIAKLFNVNFRNIHNIIRHKTYKSIKQ